MDGLEKLEQEIRVKLALATEQRQSEPEASARNVEGHERRRAAYQSAARQLMASVIRPRIEKVIAFFPNALLSPAEAATEAQWCCRFQKTPELRASTKLSFFVSPDAEIENLIVTYDLEILPIYFQFRGHEQIAVAIADAIDSRIAAWIDARLLGFVDTYLRTQTLDQYRLATPFAVWDSYPQRNEAKSAAPTTRSPEMGRDIRALRESEISWHEDEQRQFAMNRPEYE